MKKRIIALLFAVFLCVSAISPVFAASDSPRVVDNADLLDETEEVELINKLDEISERQQLDVVVLTVQSLDGKSKVSYADDYYDYNGYGYGNGDDGVLLLIAMDEREWHISTHGYGMTAFTDAGIQYIGEEMQFDLSSGYYYDAFNTYADLCDDFVTQAKNGTPFDVDSMPQAGFSFFGSLIISLGVGLVVALIATLIMKGQLKSVRYQSAAANYLIPGSMKVTDSRDMFLYRNVHREKKPENNSGGSSTHTSSSGRTHGGGGGSF